MIRLGVLHLRLEMFLDPRLEQPAPGIMAWCTSLELSERIRDHLRRDVCRDW